MRQPSAMPWPLSAVNSGPRRLSPPPRITETYRNSQPTCSTAFCSSPPDRPDLQSQAKEPDQIPTLSPHHTKRAPRRKLSESSRPVMGAKNGGFWDCIDSAISVAEQEDGHGAVL